MNIRKSVVLATGVSLLFTTPLFAHMEHSAGATGKLLHLLTGAHHVPVLLLAGVGIVYLAWRRRTGK